MLCMYVHIRGKLMHINNAMLQMLKHVMNAAISRNAKAKQISRAGFKTFPVMRVNHFENRCAGKHVTMMFAFTRLYSFLSWVTLYFVLKETFQLWILSLAPIFVE